MTDKLELVRAYLFGTPQEREEAGLILADWMHDESLYAEEACLRLRRVTMWVLPGDWEDQEFLVSEAVSPEAAVDACKRVFCTEAEKEAWLAGYFAGADYQPEVFLTEEACRQKLEPMWHDARLDQEAEDSQMVYDDSDLVEWEVERESDEDEEEDDGVGYPFDADDAALGADGSPGPQ